MQRWEEKAEANAIEPMAVSGVFRHLCAMGGNTCKRSAAVVDAPHARWQPKKLGSCIIPVLSTLGGMVITEGGDVGSAATVPPSFMYFPAIIKLKGLACQIPSAEGAERSSHWPRQKVDFGDKKHI